MTASQLPLVEPSTKAATVQQGPYRAESTFHANWVGESGERFCSNCYTLTRVYLVGEELLCSFCCDHGKEQKR